MRDTRPRLDEGSLLEWPQLASTAGLGLMTPLLLLQVSDITEMSIRHLDRPYVRHIASIGAAWLFGVLIAVYVAVFSSLGMRGLFLSVVGWLLLVFCAEQFRGDYVRPGTFDLFEDSNGSWFVPLLWGAVVGVAIGLSLRALRPQVACILSRRSFVWCLAIFAIATFDSFRRALFEQSAAWSVFAPSRYWVLAAGFLFFLVVYVLVKRSEEQWL